MAVTGADVIAAGAGRFDDVEQANEKVAQVWDAVRSYCEWHIAPVIERDELTIDGSGSPILQVPTLRLLEVHSVIEAGEPVDPSRYMWSEDGSLRKRIGCWTNEWRGVELVVDHGLEVGAALDGVVLEVATRAMIASAGQTGLRVGMVDERFGATVGGFAFLATDYLKMDKYVIPGSGADVAYTSKIEILRPREIKDRYSSDATSLDYSDPIVIDVERRVELQPVSSREQGDNRFSVVSGWVLVTPTGMDIDLRSTDRVRHGGRVLAVAGDVARWPHPIRPNMVHHVEATLEEVRG